MTILFLMLKVLIYQLVAVTHCNIVSYIKGAHISVIKKYCVVLLASGRGLF